MRNLGATTGLPIEVYGPEINMTAIVGMALGEDVSAPDNDVVLPQKIPGKGDFVAEIPAPIFTNQTQAIIFGRQISAAQVLLSSRLSISNILISLPNHTTIIYMNKTHVERKIAAFPCPRFFQV